MAGVLTRNGLHTFLANWQASSHFPVGVQLFQNDWTPTVSDVAADYENATFSGYVRGSITSAALRRADQADGSTAQVIVVPFRADNPSVANIIYGAYLLSNAAGNPLLGAARFERPLALAVGASFDFWVCVALGASNQE